MVLLVCLSLLGFCLGFARFSRFPIEYAPFFVVSMVISVLYGFAYLHWLAFGANGILIAGGLSLLLSPLYLKRSSVYEKYLTPGFVIFIGFLTLCLIQADHAFFRRWDEFTHWGPHAKLMLLNNEFLNNTNVTGHLSYPPGGALFQYLFLHLSEFSEGTAYVAQCILTMAPLAILIRHYRWQEWKQAFLSFSLAILLLVLLHIQIGVSTSMYMDGMAGIYFGMIIVAYLSASKNTHKILYLIPIVIAVTLFKQKLLPLILMATVAIIIYEIVLRLQNKSDKKNTTLFFALLLPITSILITKSWHHYLSTMHILVEWKMNLTVAKLHDAFFAKAGTTSHTIIMNYLKGWLSELPVVIVILLLSAASYFLYPLKNKKIILSVTQITLFLGLIAFSFGLLLMYLFSFSTYEGITHASMNRYLRIYNLGWALVTIYFLLDAMRESKCILSNKIKNSLLIGVLLIFTAVIIFHRRSQDIWQLRQPIIQIANATNKLTPSDAKIYSLWQKSNGFEHAILTYELTPRQSNLNCGCIGKPYTTKDVWTCHLTVSQLKEKLKSEHYLLLAYVDKNFWDHYASLLPNRHTLTPLVTYHICLTEHYHSSGHHPCTMQTHQAYLFKIINHNGHLQFINVKPLP